jgi:SAM-dependent methyltransferase
VSKAFYDYPAIYHAVHVGETRLEAEGVLRVLSACRLRPRNLLEPACGTGRFLRYFSEAGFSITGYDRSERLLGFARRQLRGAAARVESASLESYRASRPFDAALCLIGTFRHLPDDRSALRHLRSTAAALERGGIYVVGLDLVDYAACPPDEEGWEILHRGRRLRHLYMTLPPSRRSRRERVLNFVTVETPRGERLLQDEYVLRSYDLAQWRALIARSPFRLEAAFDASGKPLRLSRATRYALFALRKRAG